MNASALVLPLLLFFAGPSLAAPRAFAQVSGLEFVAPTTIPGPNDEMMSLCYLTDDTQVFGVTIKSDIQSYVLASDGCTGRYDRAYSADMMVAAQGLGFVPKDVNPIAHNTLQRNMMYYGILLAVALGLIAVIIRPVKSLLGIELGGAMRKKAALRILSAMCHVAKCNSSVAANEIALIRSTARQLTGRNYTATDVMHVVDSIDLSNGLGPNDFIAFGKGLRDREKDLMLQGVLTVATAGGRMQPTEYAFATELAYGLGMPGEDFRRVLNLALGNT